MICTHADAAVSTTSFLIVSAGIVAAAFVQGTTGVGFALVVAPVMAAFAPTLLPVCLLILMLPLNAYLAWRERTAIDGVGAKWITAGRFLGTFAGWWVVSRFATSLNLIVGITTLFAATLSLFAPPFRPNRKALVTAGIVTGVTETATGIGGPPLALIYQHQAASTVRSTIALCFLIGELMSLVVLSAGGQALSNQFTDALKFTPALVVGAFLSRFAHRRVGTRSLRACVLAFAAISGVILLVR